MAIQNQPGFIPAPFANSGTKNVIPETMPTPSASAAASWTDGFPTVCSLPLASGGIPPARADFNGLFNSITQAQAFYQSGGVYEWDATVDYGTNRMILGSDGRLYWSMAQSGPNTGAGAVDPTTDDGTYWGSAPMNAPGLGDKSDKVATTEWVKDLAVAPVYVATTGDDANDGFTSATAVKTISKGVEILGAIPASFGLKKRLYVASGSYTENIEINSANFELELGGNVIINGSMSISHGSNIIISQESSGTLAITSNAQTGFDVSFASFVAVNCDTSITSTSATACVSCVGNSMLYMNGTTTLNGTSITLGAVVAHDFGHIYMVGAVSISGNSVDIGVNTYTAGSVELLSGLTIASGCIGQICIRGDNRSFIYLSGNATLIGPRVLRSTGYSSIIIENFSSLALTRTGTSHMIEATDYARVSITGLSSGSTITVSLGSSTTGDFCHIYGFVYVYLYATNAVFSGSNNTTVFCGTKSTVAIPSSVSISGSVTGKRYNASLNGIIYVYGAGVNRIPGSTAGTVESGNYSFYG